MDKAQARTERTDAHHEIFQTVIAELSRWNFAWVAEASGVTAQTLYNWYGGQVHSPQLRTIVAVAAAIGLDVRVVRASAFRRGRHLRKVA